VAKKNTKIQINHSNKYLQAGIIVALILISMFFSIYFRSYPATLPIADKWAEDSIKNSLRSQVTASVNAQYPNLPADKKAPLVEEQINLVLEQEKEAFAEQKKIQADYIRSQLQNDEGQTYLLEIDPYYYLRRVENKLETGVSCDTYNEGLCWDNHMFAPVGAETSEDYHSIISTFVYRIVSFFKRDIPPMNVFFWMPVIISSLAVIPAFFIVKKRTNNLGGFIAAMIIAVHTSFLGRTIAGFSDTDGYNIVFPLFIFWMFIEAFEANKLREKITFSLLTGLLVGLYSKLWGGWWYIFDFMIVTIILYVIFILVKAIIKTKNIGKIIKEKELKATGISASIIIVASGIFVSLASSLSTFINAPLGALKFSNIQNAAHVNLWPNVFTTVAELNKASIGSIVQNIGGTAYFYLACLGIIITLIPKKGFKNKDWLLLGGGAFIYLLLITTPILTGHPFIFLGIIALPLAYGFITLLKDERDIDVKYTLFLAVWFVGTIYASTQGIRFVLVLVPPYAIALGIFIGQTYAIISNWTAKQWDINQVWIKGALIIIALLILIKPIQAGHQMAMQEIPHINDAWWNSLEKINQEASPDAIINSWWDYGHWFKYIGDRAVTFDGASQNTPMAHWMGKALSTNNEDETIGILRMLDCSSNKGFETLAKTIQKTENFNEIKPEITIQAKEIMKTIILLNREEANNYLEEKGFTKEERENILALTHCNPPENYFITSTDMVGKASVWGHFGAWDFKKAYIYTQVSNMKTEEAIPLIEKLLDVDTKTAGDIYYQAKTQPNEQSANAWISPWPQYLTQRAASCTENETTITCNIGNRIGTQQGQAIIIEQATVPKEHPEKTTIRIGAYNPNTGTRLGGNDITPKALNFGDGNTIEKTALENTGIDYELLVAKVNGEYKAVMATTELIDSTFTKLYYLEGAYTEHFEKFNDETSYITGDRIIVWKVQWN
jgi:dolichyl-diphosphooligosaccharide--protein glycosyltransferase